MKLFLCLATVLGVIYPMLSSADEGFDPMLYSAENVPVAAAPAGSLPDSGSAPAIQTIKPKTHLSKPVMKNDLIFQDDENVDAFSGDNPDEDNVEVEHAPAPVVPMIQKTMPDSTPVPEVGISKAPEAKVNTSQGLTDNFLDKKTASEGDLKLPIPVPNVDGTWLNKLKSDSDGIIPKLSSDDNLETMIDTSRNAPKGRSNASVFDISGVMLRMTYDQVDAALKKRGYKMTMQKFEIPNFIKWRNEDHCRNTGVIGYERLASCVVTMAKKEHHQYIESVKYSKFDTQEDVQVRFTSNFTNNKAYKIMYKSMSSNITGNSQKALYLRNIKIFDFWKKVNQKYGNPDNTEEVIWGLGGNKPYLQASTGYLVLEDPMLRELDYTRMSREDQKFMNTDVYSF